MRESLLRKSVWLTRPSVTLTPGQGHRGPAFEASRVPPAGDVDHESHTTPGSEAHHGIHSSLVGPGVARQSACTAGAWLDRWSVRTESSAGLQPAVSGVGRSLGPISVDSQPHPVSRRGFPAAIPVPVQGPLHSTRLPAGSGDWGMCPR